MWCLAGGALLSQVTVRSCFGCLLAIAAESGAPSGSALHRQPPRRSLRQHPLREVEPFLHPRHPRVERLDLRALILDHRLELRDVLAVAPVEFPIAVAAPAPPPAAPPAAEAEEEDQREDEPDESVRHLRPPLMPCPVRSPATRARRRRPPASGSRPRGAPPDRWDRGARHGGRCPSPAGRTRPAARRW